MRVVVAPDAFAGTLTAVEAAAAIARGWARRAPGDQLVQVPMSDGGAGFLDVVHAALGGELHAVAVPDPYGAATPAAVLRVGATAYVESAQAVGPHLGAPEDRDPERASSAGLGALLRAAVAGGAERVVVGLGGAATNDGGAGLLAALGATASTGSLADGPAGLAGVGGVDLGPAVAALDGVDLVAASDVDGPLLGIHGTTRSGGRDRGLEDHRLVTVDGWLQGFAEVTDRKLAGRPGTGAAGGIGFALALLGARRTSGLAAVAEAVGLEDHLAGAGLVLTGEGAFDFSSRAGKVPYGVAQLATRHLVPCVALAGRVQVGAREMRALGIESAYSVVDLVGEEQAFGAPAEALATLAERVARTWSR